MSKIDPGTFSSGAYDVSGVIKASPSTKISDGAIPTADENNPPDIKVSSVLSSVGVRTLSSSNGINSTLTPAPGAAVNENVTVLPSPLNASVICLTPS